MKERFYQEESLYGHLITYITLDISYKDYKKVRIRKIHKDYELDEFNIKFKINTNESYIYDNQIDLDIFWSLTFGYVHGLKIYVGMKNPDEELNGNLCSIINQICNKYLKPGVMFTSKEGIICKINNCSYSENILKKFLEDFVKKTEKSLLKEI